MLGNARSHDLRLSRKKFSPKYRTSRMLGTTSPFSTRCSTTRVTVKTFPMMTVALNLDRNSAMLGTGSLPVMGRWTCGTWRWSRERVMPRKPAYMPPTWQRLAMRSPGRMPEVSELRAMDRFWYICLTSSLVA